MCYLKIKSRDGTKENLLPVIEPNHLKNQLFIRDPETEKWDQADGDFLMPDMVGEQVQGNDIPCPGKQERWADIATVHVDIGDDEGWLSETWPQHRRLLIGAGK